MTDTPTLAPLLKHLQAIAQEVGKLQPSGRNQQGRPAISIEDVENALRDLLADHGIITVWSDEAEESYKEPTRSGEMTMWHLRCKVTIYCVEAPEAKIEAFAGDIGGSPAAARSFARKAFYKAMFHIASGEDDAMPRQQPVQQPTQQPIAQQPVARYGDRLVDTATGEVLKNTGAITDNQKATIEKISKVLGISPPNNLEGMTFADASQTISDLSAEYNRIKAAARTS